MAVLLERGVGPELGIVEQVDVGVGDGLLEPLALRLLPASALTLLRQVDDVAVMGGGLAPISAMGAPLPLLVCAGGRPQAECLPNSCQPLPAPRSWKQCRRPCRRDARRLRTSMGLPRDGRGSPRSCTRSRRRRHPPGRRCRHHQASVAPSEVTRRDRSAWRSVPRLGCHWARAPAAARGERARALRAPR